MSTIAKKPPGLLLPLAALLLLSPWLVATSSTERSGPSVFVGWVDDEHWLAALEKLVAEKVAKGYRQA